MASNLKIRLFLGVFFEFSQPLAWLLLSRHFRLVCVVKFVFRTNQTDELATKRAFGYSTLLFIAASNLFPLLSGFQVNLLFAL